MVQQVEFRLHAEGDLHGAFFQGADRMAQRQQQVLGLAGGVLVHGRLTNGPAVQPRGASTWRRQSGAAVAATNDMLGGSEVQPP